MTGCLRSAPHDLAHPARSWPELAEEPHLVRDRHRDAQAQARCGARQRSRCGGKKGLIERAYTLGAQLGLSVWCEDEAGAVSTRPPPPGFPAAPPKPPPPTPRKT